MKLLRRSLLAVLFVASMYAGWQFLEGNSDPVSVHYVVGDATDVALWRALVVAGLLGALITAASMGLGLARSRLETRRYRKALEDLEGEVHQLRNLPLVSDEEPASAKDVLVASGGGVGRGS